MRYKNVYDGLLLLKNLEKKGDVTGVDKGNESISVPVILWEWEREEGEIPVANDAVWRMRWMAIIFLTHAAESTPHSACFTILFWNDCLWTP